MTFVSIGAWCREYICHVLKIYHTRPFFYLLSVCKPYYLSALLALLFCSFAATNHAVAQNKTDYSIYANIIYRFTKYVDWPDQRKHGNFVIGVVGNEQLYDALVAVTRNKRIGSQDITVAFLQPTDKTYDNLDILFISDDESSSLKAITAATAGKPVLLVAEHPGMAHRGACINFVVVNDHLKLEFNKSQIEKRNLNIASELLALGTIIN